MRQFFKMASLATTIALSSAIPAAATVLNFEFFTDSSKSTLLWGAEIDFGDFAFDSDRSGFTSGITLTQPAAPFDTGIPRYNYFSGRDFLSFVVEEVTVGDNPYQYGFSAQCVPVCENGGVPSLLIFSKGNAAVGSDLLFSDFAASGITDVTPPPVNAVPLPAAGWLLGFGIAGLVALRRRKTA